MKRREVGSADEMGRLATEIGPQLRPGAIIYLVGELGAGKTTFVQALAQWLGVKRTVTSSTFVLMSSYATNGRGGIQKLVHIDLYRLTSAQARGEAIVNEALKTGRLDKITVIEWADRLGDEFGSGRRPGWWVWFEYGAGADSRVVKWNYEENA